ncbi:hypothetical protein [Streptacidiphilus cavernicola]|uniref:Asp23/Gls24 family envelope stress response protein n=1 Tax=Streptacidiphilus cavernicola TaxID=3342716 RepID=A0ABV6VZ90_9ACTN
MSRAPLRPTPAAVAEAAQAVPGVAYLSPNLRQRVRLALPQASDQVAGVRLEPGEQRVEILLAVRAGYRAATVAEQVHEQVWGVLRGVSANGWTVTVTVTAIV